jgi:hypothetical protein
MEDLLSRDFEAENIFSIWLLYFFYFLRFLSILRSPLLLLSFLDFLLCFTDEGSTEDERSEDSPSMAWSVSAGGLLGVNFLISNGLVASQVGVFLRLEAALSFEKLLWFWFAIGYLLFSNLDLSIESFLQSLVMSTLEGDLVSLTFLASSFISWSAAAWAFLLL